MNQFKSVARASSMVNLCLKINCDIRLCIKTGARAPIKLTNFARGNITVQLTSCFPSVEFDQTCKSVLNLTKADKLNPNQ